MTETVSLIGAGNMGAAIAQRLLDFSSPPARPQVTRPLPASIDGAEQDDMLLAVPPLLDDEPEQHDIVLRVWDLAPRRVEALVAVGAEAATSLHDAATSPIVVTMVPDDTALEQVALSSGGILEALPPNGIHLGLSTVSPELTRELAARYAHAGKTYLAGTVVGRPDMARQGRLGVFVAGGRTAKQRVAYILRRLSAAVGDLGTQPELAAAAKLAVNHHIALTILILGESAELARRCGIDPGEIFRVLQQCGALGGATWVTYARAAATRSHEQALFPSLLARKDIGLILAQAARVGLHLPLAELFTTRLDAAIAHGNGGKDWSVVATQHAAECQAVTQPA